MQNLTTFHRSLTTCPGWRRSSVAIIILEICPLEGLRERATHGSWRRLGLLGFRVSIKLSIALELLLLLLLQVLVLVMLLQGTTLFRFWSQSLLEDWEYPLTRIERVAPLILPNPTNPVAVVVDLTEFTSSTAASAVTSTQGFGSVELKHRWKKIESTKEIKCSKYRKWKET